MEIGDQGDGRIVVGTPPYSSPDPATDGLRQFPLPGSPVTDDNSAAEDGEPQSSSENAPKLAGDWKELVEAATTQDELDEVAQAYSESDGDFVTVEKAIEDKQAEIDAAEEEGGE